jgi:hypothetical protein
MSSSPFFIEEQDAERPVVDDAFGELGNTRQQLVEVEDGRHFPADLRERLEGLGVAPLPLEQPRVDERGGDMRSELPGSRPIREPSRSLSS